MMNRQSDSMLPLALLAAAGLAVPALAQVSFRSDDFEGGDVSTAVAVADFDDDGAPDVAVANRDSDEVVVLRNVAAEFDTELDVISFDPQSRPVALAAADFDNNGTPDLAVVLLGTDEVALLLNQGDGTFGDPFFFPVGNAPTALAVGDLDGAVGLDMVVSNEQDDTLTVLLADVTDGFVDIEIPAGIDNQRTEPRGLAIGDLDDDGNPDVAVALERQDQLGLLFGLGDGTFDEMVTTDVGDGPTDVAIYDADGLNELDIATANSISDDVTILLAAGGGTFADNGDFDAGNFSGSIAVGDIDGDGVLDLVTANGEGDDVSVLLGDGDGNYAAPDTSDTGNFPFDVALGDFDDDGALDIVTANQEADTITVLTAREDGTDDPNDDGGLPPIDCGMNCGPMGMMPMALTLLGIIGLKLNPRSRRR